ncbi:FbpB family small basic protein [Peribacillus loiseleuriae]
MKGLKRKKKTFEELINENKQELLQDEERLAKIEDRIERRHLQKAE